MIKKGTFAFEIFKFIAFPLVQRGLSFKFKAKTIPNLVIQGFGSSYAGRETVWFTAELFVKTNKNVDFSSYLG